MSTVKIIYDLPDAEGKVQHLSIKDEPVSVVRELAEQIIPDDAEITKTEVTQED